MPRTIRGHLSFGIISELFVNIAAGLFLIAATVLFSNELIQTKVLVLSLHFAGGIFSLIIAHMLRKESRNRK